ncbi:MAG: hypothetical protein A3I66_01240 [Burkholderiales bacterium RIFCSPLOWO2_02_FULL_57_36]|nr:MAG: hypothetical protein A3I66_01240 [Burkholderiales bacterium RIFCSPLOWO2_02_FULL_57_36]
MDATTKRLILDLMTISGHHGKALNYLANACPNDEARSKAFKEIELGLKDLQHAIKVVQETWEKA